MSNEKYSHFNENKSLIRDNITGAIISDCESYKSYKRRMKDIDDIREMKNRLNNIECMFNELIKIMKDK